MDTDRVAMGAVTSGIPRGTLVDRIVDFVRSALADWRDDPTRPDVEAEVPLNAQLCKFLKARARVAFPMITFNHEEPQGPHHSVDLSVTRATPGDGSIYEAVLVIEGKRLPAPAKERAREYLTGFAKCSGAVQRFKLALHGVGCAQGMIVAYVQRETVPKWLGTLNGWIRELACEPHTEHDAWVADEVLRSFTEYSDRTSRCESEHARVTGERVTLHHAWVEMTGRSAASPRRGPKPVAQPLPKSRRRRVTSGHGGARAHQATARKRGKPQ